MQITVNVNGESHELEADEDTPLLWVIREALGLTGTKFGCGIAVCGACTVLVDGNALRSCSVPASLLQGRQITTIEGLAADSQLHPVQQAWIAHQVPQCGYCQSGVIMAVTALLAKYPQPSDALIDAEVTNLCRCGTYERIRAAIHSVATATAS